MKNNVKAAIFDYCDKLTEEQQFNLLDRFLTALTRNISVAVADNVKGGQVLTFRPEDKGFNELLEELLRLMLNGQRAQALELKKELLSRTHFITFAGNFATDGIKGGLHKFLSGLMINEMYDDFISAVFTKCTEGVGRQRLFEGYLAEKIAAAIQGQL